MGIRVNHAASQYRRSRSLGQALRGRGCDAGPSRFCER